MPVNLPRSENWSSVYLPKREALGLKSVRAFPNVSNTNSEAGSWVANFDPFFPGLLTLSSSSDLIASRRFSDFPLPVSPLKENKALVKCYVKVE